MAGSEIRKATSSVRVNLSASLGRKRFGGSKTLLAICGVLALGCAANLPATPAQAQFRGFWAPDDDGYPPPVPPRDIGHRREAWAPPPPYMEGPPPMEEERPPGMDRPRGMERMPMSIAELRRRATLAGLKLLGTPHRRGDVYVAFGEDSHGTLHHVTFDAYEGRIVENEVSTTAAKTAPAKPATPPATAAAPAKPNAPAAAAASTATAKTAPDKAALSKAEPVKPAPAKPVTPAKAAATAKPAAAPAETAAHSPAPSQIAPSVTTPAKTAKSKDEPAPAVTADEDDLSPIRPKPGDHTKLPDDEIDKD